MGVVERLLPKREAATSQQDSGPSSVPLLFGGIHRCRRRMIFMTKSKCSADCLVLCSGSLVSRVFLEKRDSLSMPRFLLCYKMERCLPCDENSLSVSDCYCCSFCKAGHYSRTPKLRGTGNLRIRRSVPTLYCLLLLGHLRPLALCKGGQAVPHGWRQTLGREGLNCSYITRRLVT